MKIHLLNFLTIFIIIRFSLQKHHHHHKLKTKSKGLSENTIPSISCGDGNDFFCASCEHKKCDICFDSKNVNGICKPIKTKIENCTRYDANDKCIYCKYGYYLSNGACLKSYLKNCYTHHIQDSTKCGVCNGYVLKRDGTCDETQPCKTENCLSCVIENDQEMCLWCRKNFILAHSKGYHCVEAKGLLRNCFSQNSYGQCTTCKYGYYFDPTKGSSLSNCVKSSMYNGKTVFFGSYLILKIILILT
jgi:hypothetical protein